MINVGIIGYGFAGRGFHAYLIGRVPELRLTAVASRDPARRRQAEQDYRVATYATVDDLLERSGVDLVVVATPHDTHAALTCQALNAGKHVVVDKVMCLTAAEADTMIAAAQRSRRLLSVFQNRRWDWDFLTVRQVLTDGLLGAPYLIEASVARYRPPRGWRSEVDASGGLLYDWGAHLIDHALQLVPEPVVSVTCDLQHCGWGAAIGSYARLLLRFSGGLLYSIELGNLVRLDRPRWVVLGERGALVKHGLDPQEPAMLAGAIDGATEDPVNRARIRTDLNGLATELVIDSVRGDWTDYYRNVAAALAGHAELAVTPEQARRALTVFDAAMQSARTGTTVRLER